MMGIRSFSGILKTVLNEIQGFAFLSRSALAKIISPPLLLFRVRATLYTRLNAMVENVNALVKDIKDNPKRYLKFSLF